MAARNVIDRLVGYFSPRAGLERHFHRRQLTRAYEAASPRDTWRPRRAGASANADHRADATALRAKARALVQNVPYVAAGLGNLVDATIGAGVKDHAVGTAAAEIDALKAQWKVECDADGRLDYDGILAAAYRAMEQDGEVLIRLRPRFASDGLAVPLQLQLLEIDWLDSTRTGGYNGNTIVNGIEYDVLGRLVAYWLWSTHPGDVVLLRGMRVQSQRVDAKSIIHLFPPERPGQGRGFPRLAPVIARVRDLSLYEDAELARKNLETRLGVLYSGDPTQVANPAADGEMATQADADTTGNLGELRSGAMTRLPAGSEVTVVTPTVVEGYTDYVRQQLHLIASGMGVTYEMLTGDMNEVNFSSARVRRLDMRRSVERMQWLTLKPRLLDPLHRAFVDAAVLAGKLRRPANYAVAYSFPKWDYVNPQQEIEADTKEIAAGLCSISEKIRQRGDDPEAVFAELASDFDKLKASGTLDILLFLQSSGKAYVDPAEAAKAASTAVANASKSAREEEDRLRAHNLEMTNTVVAAIAQQPAPTFTFRAGDTTVQVPERSLTVEAPVVHVAPAEAPIVNVAPAEVRVDVQTPAQPAPIVNVAPAEVRVDVQPATVELKMPKRKQVSEHERDKAGRIKRTTTTDE